MADKTILGELVEKKEQSMVLNIDTIVSKMFHFHTNAHLLHFQTRSFSEHKALDKLYKKLVDLKDSIGEQAMGYLNQRPAKLIPYPVYNYSPGILLTFLNDIHTFAYQLEEWADENQYCNLSNLAQEVSGLAASTRYLLTLE